MLGLELREEFRGQRLKGTAIELTNNKNTGATQVSAGDFLRITYPTHDLLKTLEAVGPSHGRPLTLKGERGQGKSHLMAALFHAFSDNDTTHAWLKDWSEKLGEPRYAKLPLREGMHVISASLHRQRNKFLWDLLFENHPYGKTAERLWKEKGTDVPSDEILIELFTENPTALILDEFQTWYDGLTNTKQYPYRNWAFNFIQILSEIAHSHPELLVLVVSVRNGNTDAFQQIQRVNPIIVDFKGPSARKDRLNLLLHRLFENRMQVAPRQISETVECHVGEYLRLLNIPSSEHERTREEFVDAWPFAPHLMELLEDHVLVATNAQETRDLIRILADLFKRRGENEVIITASDFRLEDEKSGIAALLDSVANQHHQKLREKALRNLDAVNQAKQNTGTQVPNLEGVVSALWLRSLAESNFAGADQATLQADITKDKAIDDNAFQVELGFVVENSFNIHEDGNRYIFREEENPQAKLIANARNDRLFQDGEDIDRLAKEVRYVIAGPENVSSKFRVVVLPRYWAENPWDKIDESERPSAWDERIPILVLPDSPSSLSATLGKWLKENLQKRRNAVRFLIPRSGSDNFFAERHLIVLSRAIHLAEQWKGQNPEYSRLFSKYQNELRGAIKVRFDRFAIISNWNFQEPKNCQFHIDSHKAEGAEIPGAIHQFVSENLFIPEDFESFILKVAQDTTPVSKVLEELREPRPNGEDCIPWLGDVETKEEIIKLCAKGKIALNLRGTTYLQLEEGEDEERAWTRMRGKLGSGRHLEESYITTRQAVQGTLGIGAGQPPANTPHSSGPQPQPAPPNPGQPGGEPSIFGNGSGSYQVLNSPATSALNLLGKTESWGITPGTQLRSMRIAIDNLTGAQLQDLLKKLPDGMTYELDVEKED